MTSKKMLWWSRTVPVKGKTRNCCESQSIFLTKPSLALNDERFWHVIAYPFLLHCKGAVCMFLWEEMRIYSRGTIKGSFTISLTPPLRLST